MKTMTKVFLGTLALGTAVGVGVMYHEEIGGGIQGIHHVVQVGREQAEQLYRPTPTSQLPAPAPYQKQPGQLPLSPVLAPQSVPPEERLQRMEELLNSLVTEMASAGKEASQQVYGQLQQEIERRLQQTEQQACEHVVSSIVDNFEGVITAYLSPEAQAERYALGISARLSHLSPAGYHSLAEKVIAGAPEALRDELMKKESLDVWLQRLERNFGVVVEKQGAKIPGAKTPGTETREAEKHGAH